MGAILGQLHLLRHVKVHLHRRDPDAWWLLMLLACAMPALAQIQPDAGSIQRDLERHAPSLPPPLKPQIQSHPLTEQPATQAQEVQFKVGEFKLRGVTLLPVSEVQALLGPWLGVPITFSGLEQAKQAIADAYQRQGWLARPQIPEQELQDDGELLIDVIEGRFGQVRIEQEALVQAGKAIRIDRDRIRRTFLSRHNEGDFIYMPNIERAISLLNDTPGLGVSASLVAGEGPGASDIVVSPSEKGMFSGTVTLDNTGSRSTGAFKQSVAMSVDSPRGLGDQWSVNLMRSEGVRYGRIGYILPIGYDGWRLGVNASDMSYRVIFPMSASNPSYPRGAAYTQGVSLTWPALRSPASNVYFSSAYDRKHFVNEIYSPDTQNINALSNKRLDVGSLSLSGDHSDSLGEGGMTQWSLGWTGGSVDLSGNVQNQQSDRQGIQTEGQYAKYSASVSRLQRLSSEDSLWLSLQGQHSSKNLDSSERFTLGGAQGIRAYPTAEGAGDHGWTFTLEERRTLTPQWQGVLFYDFGRIRVNHQAYTGANGPEHVTLKGGGLSLNYSLPGRGMLRLTWARRISDNPLASDKTGLDTDGSLVRNRIWLSLNAFL